MKRVKPGSGFQLEAPELTIAWGIRPAELEAAFHREAPGVPLSKVRSGYYVAQCKALGNLRTMVGFHFSPLADNGTLNELEFYDNGSAELAESFVLYQRHLEATFGAPSAVDAGTFSPDMPSYEWRNGRVRVAHFVVERFGPEEHVRVLRRPWWAAWLR